MCISLEKKIPWKIIFGQEKVRENCRGSSAATLLLCNQSQYLGLV